MRLLSLLLLLVTAQKAAALSIDWAGGYRLEFLQIDRPTLAEGKEQKTYGLNYLHLDPKIVASDGINIIGRFDLFTNEIPSYSSSQLGSVIGGGLRRAGNSGVNTTSDHAESSLLRVSQLYLNVNQEYGSLIVGRAPIQFGLGMTHNAGLGEFDHWYDTEDLVAYRFLIDNLSLMPMWGRVSQKDFGTGVTISDQALVMEYDNKDTRSQAGVFYQLRNSSRESNDSLSAGSYSAPPGYTYTTDGAWSTKLVNLFFGRSWDAFQFKLEASFLTGDSGITSTVGSPPTLPAVSESIKLNAYAVAAEMLFPAQDSDKWEYGVKLGMASGDDPKTTGVDEGYQMDRNYDVAMLLFNHRMGQKDFLTTKRTHTDPSLSVGNSADDEEIGNTMYIAPSAKYLWNEKLDLKTTIIYAQLLVNPTNSLDFKKDLGTELDMELIYKPRERITWSNGFGILFPGAAWQDGASNLDNKVNFGLSTKAAITF